MCLYFRVNLWEQNGVNFILKSCIQYFALKFGHHCKGLNQGFQNYFKLLLLLSLFLTDLEKFGDFLYPLFLVLFFSMYSEGEMRAAWLTKGLLSDWLICVSAAY